jgi:hypothetical protein
MTDQRTQGRGRTAAAGFDWRLLPPMMLGSVLNPINSTIIAVTLVPIGHALGAPPSQTAWLVSALYLATAWISYLHEVKTPDAGWFDLAVIHHTDCGSGLYADDELRRDYVEQGGYDDETIAALAVIEPAETLRTDVERLRAFPRLSSNVKVTGHVYDLKTGLLTTVAD